MLFSLLTAITPWLIGLLGIVWLTYLYITWTHNYFRKRGIPGPETGIMGSFTRYKTEGLIAHDMDVVKKYGRVAGIFHARVPVMLISDADMIKEIGVKHFSNFTNRLRPEPTQKAFKSAVSVVEDDHWKFIRSVLSPTFSSGRMRQMVGLIQNCTDRLVKNIEKHAEGRKSVEMKSMMGSFTMDVIASTGFGIDVDSQNSPDNAFVKNAKTIMSSGLSLPLFVSMMIPFTKRFFELIGWYVFPKQPMDFFFRAMAETVDDRRKNPSDRPDMLQLMLNTHKMENKMEADDDPDAQFDAGKMKKRPLTNDEIMSNSVVFMLAGYDTTSNALTFATYLLAANPKCQEKLFEEIHKNLGSELATYDNVMKLPYLDRVFRETLRMYPPAVRFARKATEDITVKGWHIEAGTSVQFPIYAIHHDPEFWPEPETFDPDRFLPENQTDIHKYIWAPFGIGPRNCLGMRLAFLEFKMALATVVQHFRFYTAPDTEIPPKLEKGGFLRAENGVYLRVERRSESS